MELEAGRAILLAPAASGSRYQASVRTAQRRSGAAGASVLGLLLVVAPFIPGASIKPP